jgi:hypothetical protein
MPKTKKKSGADGKIDQNLERRAQIAEAAYFLAEQRGFEPGQEWDDWFKAENMLEEGSMQGARG